MQFFYLGQVNEPILKANPRGSRVWQESGVYPWCYQFKALPGDLGPAEF